MTMKTVIVAALVILTVSFVNGQSDPVCDPSTGISDEDCQNYVDEGAITVVFDGQTDTITDVQTDLFKSVIANVSNDYVLLPVTPEHVIIVQRVENDVTSEKGLKFFILNPSGSTIMPVALRRQELYLMVKLNNDRIDMYLSMGSTEEVEVTAISPPSTYPLAIPAWAIAIIGYVGLIIFIYCVMVLTSDWRKKWSDDFEASLEKEYYENTNGVSVASEIPMKKMPVNGNDYEVVTETKSNGTPKYKEMGVQTPRHVAVQVDPEDVILSQSSPAPSQASTTEVVIENGHKVDDENQYDSPDAPDTAHIVPMPTKGDAADKEADEAAAAIEGAINEGFAADEPDVSQPSTNL